MINKRVEVRIPRCLYKEMEVWANALGITVEKFVRNKVIEQLETIDFSEIEPVRLNIYFPDEYKLKLDVLKRSKSTTLSYLVNSLLLMWLIKLVR